MIDYSELVYALVQWKKRIFLNEKIYYPNNIFELKQFIDDIIELKAKGEPYSSGVLDEDKELARVQNGDIIETYDKILIRYNSKKKDLNLMGEPISILMRDNKALHEILVKKG